MCEAMRRLMKDEIADEVNNAVTIAEKKAKLEGKMEEKKDMALSLSKMGISIDKIAEAAKVSVAMVQEWLSSSMSPAK